MTTIYKQERHHDNWTGRVSRQSRITGYWSEQRREADSTPLVAWVIGAAMIVVLFLAAYL